MKTQKSLKTILLITILSLSIYCGLTLNNVDVVVEDELIEKSGNGFGQSLNIVLVIENERNGEIIYRMEKDDDLALRSLAGLIHMMLRGSDAELSYGYKLVGGGIQQYYIDQMAKYIMKTKSSMYVGTGTTAPTYEDYNLETQIYVDEVEALGYSVSGLQMNATFVTTFNILNTYAITEAGFTFWANIENSHFMVFRDVFSAVNVVSGDLLTVKYIIMFN